MFLQLNSVIIDADAENRQELAQFLGGHGVTVVGQFPTHDSLAALLARPDGPQLVVINLDPVATDKSGPSASETLKKVGHLPRQYPGVSFFVMSQSLEATLLMEAMHMGVREFIPLPMSVERFTQALEMLGNSFGMGKRAKTIHVIPTVGGCGSTTVACNVAASLAKIGKTALLDLDLMRGGVAGNFDLRPRYTIADVMDSADKVDRQLLDNALAIHQASGLAVLGRPELPEDTQRVNHSGLQRLMGLLHRVYDHVVLDSMMSIAPLYATQARNADVNLIVMQLNIPSAKNAERYVGALRRMGIESSKIRLVVNRHEKRGGDITPEDVERAMGLKVSWRVPNDFKNAIAAINFGEPMVLRSPKSEAAVSLRELAAQLVQRDGEMRTAA